MPQVGRFVEEDSNKGNTFTQLSLNYYIHCLNNPVYRIDRDGMDSYIFYDPNLHSENGQKSTAEIHKKYLEDLYPGTKVELIPVTSLHGANGFIQKWNAMGSDGAKIDAVIINAHGNPNQMRLYTPYVDKTDTSGNTVRVEETNLEPYRVKVATWATLGLQYKEIDTVILLSCETGKTIKDPNNIASVIASTPGIQRVIASDQSSWGLISSGKDSSGKRAEPPTGDGWKVYRGTNSPVAIGHKFDSVKGMIEEANKQAPKIALTKDTSEILEPARLRDEPNTASGASSLKAGDTFEFIEFKSGESLDGNDLWYKIKINDKIGYVHSSLAKLSLSDQAKERKGGTKEKEKEKTTSNTTNKATKVTFVQVTGTDVRIRKGPGSDYRIIRHASSPEKFIYKGKSSDAAWYEVEFSDGSPGYISTSFSKIIVEWGVYNI